SDQIAVAGAPKHASLVAIGPIGAASRVPHEAVGRGTGVVALRIIKPDGLAGLGINAGRLIQRSGNVHHAASHQRRGLEGPNPRLAPPSLKIWRLSCQGGGDGSRIGAPLSPRLGL